MLDWSQHTYQTLQAALLLMLKIFIAIAICILVNWQISSDMQSGVGTSDDEDEFVVLADVLGLRHSVNINIDNK